MRLIAPGFARIDRMSLSALFGGPDFSPEAYGNDF
jgi:hypothetical protein